jgi:ribose 5-phosphate isomerase B
MRVYIASDHGGFPHKTPLSAALQESGYEVVDLGAHELDPNDDYPYYAELVGKAVQQEPNARGILLCRSGEGMQMAVNKMDGIRAALVWNAEVARETRQDNDANVIVLPADFMEQPDLVVATKAFLETSFSGEERHVRRLEQVARIEEQS